MNIDTFSGDRFLPANGAGDSGVGVRGRAPSMACKAARKPSTWAAPTTWVLGCALATGDAAFLVVLAADNDAVAVDLLPETFVDLFDWSRLAVAVSVFGGGEDTLGKLL